MENRDLILEVELLLGEATNLIAQGSITVANEKIEEAKKKLRPIGTGTLGPEPRQ